MKKRINKNIYIHAVLIITALLLLAFVDVIVLEKIYHPISQKHSISWTEFETPIHFFGKESSILWWHVAFGPLCYGLFILLGIAAKSWRLALSGIIAFMTGWEDILYYLIQLKWLPVELSWLDSTPIIGLTRFITRTAHVTDSGLIISAVIGLIVAGLILFSYNPLKRIFSESASITK